MIRLLNKKIQLCTTVFFIVFVFFLCAPVSQAATEVSFKNQTTSTIYQGDIFSIDLNISSLDEAINVIDGTVMYDSDRLIIKEVNIESSLVSLWVKKPIFDNKKGELRFIGGIPDGFDGTNANILEITFRAKQEGQTLIGFRDIFSVLANDGKGTIINPWLKPLSLSINKKPHSLATNILSYLANICRNNKYYILIFVSIILFVILKLIFRFKKKRK